MWKKIKEKFLNRQFITFAVIGVINTLIALLINKGMLALGIEVGMASVFADVLAFIPSYLMNIKFTYHQKYSWKSFVTFPVSYVPGWIISFLIVELLSRGFDVPERYAKLVSVPIYVPVNFLFMTFIVGKFGTKGNEKKDASSGTEVR
ncbi:GtrA family protein [Galactobacillus timonensis]|uniref:GtrA family protein n=1 Tax=Galactobacillus timonensis TaxID=2041840 RepID=UPI000C82F74B|nr:GtrA family protein [Galactobacillus timonensis]